MSDCVCFQDYIAELEVAHDEINRLRAREARLQEALRPFNCVKGNWTHQPDDLPLTVAFGTDVRFSLTLGDFRRASAALGEEKK
jgi:hypothetical protein